jgi:hypothetical protein
MSFKTIRSAIGEKLQSLTGTGGPLAYVYDHHKLGLDGYPSVTFEPSSLQSEFGTTRENMRNYAFEVIVHQELATIWRDEAISTLVDATDTVIEAFDQDYSIGGTVDYLEAVPAEFWEITTEDSVIAYARITLKCHALIPIS